MKRNSKALNDGRENKRNRSYMIACTGHAKFTKHCRRVIRAKANQAMREGRDPKAKEYYD